jgi:16S rRNA (guanine527-N7)-methyltransferase
MLILKGPSWVAERGEARHYGLMRELALRKLTTYLIPGTKAESVLLQITPKKPPADAPPTARRDG